MLMSYTPPCSGAVGLVKSGLGPVALASAENLIAQVQSWAGLTEMV